MKTLLWIWWMTAMIHFWRETRGYDVSLTRKFDD